VESDTAASFAHGGSKKLFHREPAGELKIIIITIAAIWLAVLIRRSWKLICLSVSSFGVPFYIG